MFTLVVWWVSTNKLDEFLPYYMHLNELKILLIEKIIPRIAKFNEKCGKIIKPESLPFKCSLTEKT